MINSLLAFVFVLGVLVFVHELGHFLVARWLGVRVLAFAIGFGPNLLKVTRGGIDYCIKAFPLGGFVKMAGENPDDPRSGAPDEFLSRSKWDRFRILVAGPAMNVALSVVLMWVVLLQGAQVPAFHDDPVIVGEVTKDSPAEKAGLLSGDRITRVGSAEVKDWEQFYLAIGGRAGRDVPITLLREGRERVLRVRPTAATRLEIGDIGVLPDVHPSISTLEPNGPAAAAGFRTGDVLLSVNGVRTTFSAQVSTEIRKYPEKAITVSVARGSQRLDVTVTPRRQGEVGVIGITISDAFDIIQPGPVGAFTMSLRRNVQFAGLIVQTLAGLFTRETSPRQLMGPVAIAQLSGDYAAAGWLALFTFMASLSLNLGLLNLLPIPVLDGGHIFIMGAEAVARRDFSVKVKERLLLAGFVVLMLLMATVVVNDLSRIPLFERLMSGAR
ncbi:MAG: RIP metalloprotease RseP [Acidobacteriota bacterium]